MSDRKTKEFRACTCENKVPITVGVVTAATVMVLRGIRRFQKEKQGTLREGDGELDLGQTYRVGGLDPWA